MIRENHNEYYNTIKILLGYLLDYLLSTHERNKNVRNPDAAVGILILLDDGRKHTACRQSGSVESVNKMQPSLGVTTADIAPAGLKVPRV